MPDPTRPQQTAWTPRHVHEGAEVHTPSIIGGGLAILGVILVVLLSAKVLLALMGGDQVTARSEGPRPGTPHLQASPRQQLEAIRGQNQQHLHGFGWVDKQRQVAHIPIDLAVRLLAEGSAPTAAARIRESQP